MIVLSLLGEGDRYGFEIYKEVLSRSDDRYELKEPSLYSAFRRLEKQGHIKGYWGEESQGGRRKYYMITAEGRLLAEKLKEEWERAKNILDMIIEERDGRED